MTFRSTGVALALAVFGGALLAACSTGGPPADPRPAATTPSASPSSAAPTPRASATPTLASPTSATPQRTARPSTTSSPVPEPTTTNTLPPPPQPSRPAPSTAGKLSASSLPVPTGWKTVAGKGGAEEGYEGNGTWVHARDPRYAAQDVITLGCADVTRDDYRDPVAALEGSYSSAAGQPGIGLVLQFANATRARDYFSLYRTQVAACQDPAGPVLIKIIASDRGLIDRRTYPDGDWTEVASLRGSRLTLIILGDPGHAITKAAAERLLVAADRQSRT